LKDKGASLPQQDMNGDGVDTAFNKRFSSTSLQFIHLNDLDRRPAENDTKLFHSKLGRLS
jgi:hypothetical protein